MKSVTQYDLPKDATVGQVLNALVSAHPQDSVKIVSYFNGTPKTIRIICDHQETTP